MITDFTVLSGTTVPITYSWDFGTPLETITTAQDAYTTTQYVSGYAPGLNVIFVNRSVSDENFEFINYDWDFGDYYHNVNNTASLSCVSFIEHLYIMPGTYTVTLRHRQARRRSILETNPLLCRGKFDIRWFWSELECTKQTLRTWDETACELLSATVSPNRWTPKWWDDEVRCFAKHCKIWSWYDLAKQPGRANPVTWADTQSLQQFEKKWMFEDNETQCSVNLYSYLDTLEVNEQVRVKTIVEVKEIPPVANITCITQPLTGITPFTVEISPSGCTPGSFPIDRIDWNFGDGTPIKTTTRYTTTIDTPDVVYTNVYPDDPADIRNYNVKHTYVRNRDSYAVFYPSLTCYSANTASSDSCCTTVGPILLTETPSENITLLKTRNTLKGNIYAFNINKNIAFFTEQNDNIIKVTVPPNIPPTTLKNSSNIAQNYYGHAGINYPPLYFVDCKLVVPVGGPTKYLVTDDNDPYNIDIPDFIIEEEEGVPIFTDRDTYIVP
jgi:hypothetical protein